MNQDNKMSSTVSSPELERRNILSSADQFMLEVGKGLRWVIRSGIDDIKDFYNDTENEWGIRRVPRRLRELNEDAYTPRLVSIGPFHSDRDMKVHKTRYMLSIFQRTTLSYKQIYDQCTSAIGKVFERVRSCYDLDVEKSHHHDVIEILLVDSCFILELFLRWKFSINSQKIRDDPLFGAATISSLRRDLALLENQIPFFVLQPLFGIIMEHCRDQEGINKQIPLNQLCASFFNLEQNLNPSISSNCKHLLDLIRSCHLPRWELMNSSHTKPKQRWELIPCVTILREDGIKFVKGDSINLFDIEFSPKGVLKIPMLCMDDAMESLLRNIIAFEQYGHGTSHHFTSYAVLMDCLIDSPADAEFLQQKRIIANYLGNAEEFSKIFNKISTKVFVDDFFFDTLCVQVNKYSTRTLSGWAKARAIFVHDYCSSPWKFIGIVAGSLLLLLTVFQTGYGIASYYHQ